MIPGSTGSNPVASSAWNGGRVVEDVALETRRAHNSGFRGFESRPFLCTR